MKIQPTPEQVKSDLHIGDNCPYYQAIVEACPNLKGHVNVGREEIIIFKESYHENSAESYGVPATMTSWINKYDEKRWGYGHYTDWSKVPIPPEVDLPFLDEYCDKEF